MQVEILRSGRDTLLVAVPFVLCLVGTVFRLDGWFFKSGSRPWISYGLPRHAWYAASEPILTDPDGKVVDSRIRDGGMIL